MTKLPRDDEELVETLARLLESSRKGILAYVGSVQEATWELAVQAAMRGDLIPAFEKLLDGKVPPPQTRAKLIEALVWAKKKGRKGRSLKYWGPLAKREYARTPLLRAVKRYEQLRERGLDSETRLKLAVEWVNENPLQYPPKNAPRRVTESQLENEMHAGKARRKMRI